MSPLPEDAPPLPQLSARERIYEALKEWIVDGILEPEEQLRDAELAERFGVSRTPVREALRQLEDEQLVETARNRWTRVAPLDMELPNQTLPILSALETLALRTAWPLSDEDKDRLDEANAAVAKAIERRRAKEALIADLRFHGVFDGCSGNDELIAILGRLRDRTRRLDMAYWARPALARSSVEEHQRIIEAMRADDLERSIAALEDHWDNERVFRVGDVPSEAA